MQNTLAELEKIITRQVQSGFVGKINILRSPNKEIMGNIFIEGDSIVYFNFLNKKSYMAIHHFVYILAKGLNVSFVVEPEVNSSSEEKFNLRI